VALRGGLGNEDSAGEGGESEDDDGEGVNEGEEDSGDGAGDGAADSGPEADAGDEVSREGRDDETDQVNEEEGTEGGDGEGEGRSAEVEGDPCEDADEGEEDVESYGEGGDETAVAEHLMDLPWKCSRSGGWVVGRSAAAVREPGGDGGGADERGQAEDDEADAPGEVIGEDAGGDAAEEAAEGGSADVEAHDEGDALGWPLFTDVGDDNGDDAGDHDALKESPEDELGESGGCRGEQRGDGDAEDGVDDDAFAREALGKCSEDGGGDGDAEGGSGDGHADADFGCMEDVGEEREDGLRAVELEEGADSAEGYGGGALGRGSGLIGLRGWLQGSGYRWLEEGRLRRVFGVPQSSTERVTHRVELLRLKSGYRIVTLLMAGRELPGFFAANSMLG